MATPLRPPASSPRCRCKRGTRSSSASAAPSASATTSSPSPSPASPSGNSPLPVVEGRGLGFSPLPPRATSARPTSSIPALEREIERYRPYLALAPDEAQARAERAAPEEKKLLEKLAAKGWGPIHMYFRLSPRDLADLRAGQRPKFSAEPEAGEQQLPA